VRRDEKVRFISLKTKITVVVALLTTVTTGLLGFYLVWGSYQALRLQAQEGQLALAKTLAWQVNTGLSQACQAVALLAERPETARFDKMAITREMTLVTTSTELLDGLLLVSNDGHLVAKSLTTIGREDLPPREFLMKTLQHTGPMKNGYFLEAYKTKTESVAVAIGAPVVQHKRLKGLLVGVIYLPIHTIGNLQVARIGKTGYAILVNENGVALTHPNRSRWLKDIGYGPLVTVWKDKKEGVLQFENQDGQEILAAFATVESVSWGVIVRQPAEECYEPAFNLFKFMTLFLILTLGATLWVSLVLSEKFVRPIMNLAGEVGHYESGRSDLKRLGSLKPKDEVGLLAQSIGRMAERIQDQTIAREKAYARALRTERKLAETERLALIGQFSAGLAHELNNPLAVILGSARMAQESKGAKLRKWLGDIHEQADRARRLVSDLLDFAKPVRVKRQNLDLAELVRETWNQIPMDLGRYRLKCHPNHFKVSVDPDRFQQVFINLLRNAAESMPGGGEVRVEMQRKGNRIQAAVIDSGKGILKKDQNRIFKPFFTTKRGGTGLGLAVSRAILKAHQGQLVLESNKPKGARASMEWLVV